jgi:(p)ppGpp synthase/HD superfamily hydrolase
LILENNDIEIIADELFDIIQEKGITNGEINIFGKQVDDLVDKFNHYE